MHHIIYNKNNYSEWTYLLHFYISVHISKTKIFRVADNAISILAEIIDTIKDFLLSQTAKRKKPYMQRKERKDTRRALENVKLLA